MSKTDLPRAHDVAQQLATRGFTTAPLRDAIGAVQLDTVGDIERVLQWADDVFESVTPENGQSIATDADLEPPVLWCLTRWFERMNLPDKVLEVLSSPRLATANNEMEAYRLVSVARAHSATADHERGAWALRQAINLSENPSLLRKAANLADRILKQKGQKPVATCRLALLGDATFTGYVAPLKAFAFARQIGVDLYLGAYGQHFQELQSPESGLSAFKPTVVAIALTWRALGLSEEEPDPDAAVRRAVQNCKEMWALALARGASLVIQHNFEIPETSAYGHLSASLPGGRGRVLQRINLELAHAADEATGVAVLDLEHLAGSIGKRAWSDDRMWTAAKHYPSSVGTILLARHQIAFVRAVHGTPSKCLVLDLDNTLWGGVIGEDGLSGIRLGGTGEGEAFAEFQRYVKSVARRGILLAVCSKNDEDAAKSPFLEHPDMVLKLEDIAAFRVNWGPKHENLRHIAKDLNIGVDSLVFIDDNPAERAAVRAMLPEVEVPELGSDPSGFATIISRSLAFEALAITQEDRARTKSYIAATARRELEGKSASLDDYLDRLGMSLSFGRLDEVTLPRAVQLIGKTNQFNLTTSRMTNAEVRCYMGTDAYARVVRLADQFTDHGITGLMLAKRSDDALCIDEWILSCRILGRRVEEAMFAAAWNFAHRAGYRVLRASYRETAKNQQVENLYDRLGMTLESQGDGSRSYIAEVNLLLDMPSCFASIQEPDDLESAAPDASNNSSEVGLGR